MQRGAAGLPESAGSGLEQRAKFFAAFDGLAAGALAQRVEDLGGGLHADVAGDQRRLQLLEALSSTVRVMATMSSILEVNDSRVRVTACFMRLKKPDFLFLVLLLLRFFGFFEAAKQADEFGHGVQFQSRAREHSRPGSGQTGRPGVLQLPLSTDRRSYVSQSSVQKGPLNGTPAIRKELARRLPPEKPVRVFPRMRLRKQTEVT